MARAPKKDAIIRARIDSRIKDEATEVLAEIGLTPSAACRLLMTKIAAEKALPFSPLVPNRKTLEAAKELNAGKGKRAATVSELLDDLNS